MTHVHKAIFPAILEVKQEEDLGLPESTAIAAAIPSVVQAMSKTMACREMCHATIATCSCGNATLTFGEALENAEVNDDGFAELGLQLLGQNFSDTLFAEIWDKPVCDIFTSKDDADFAGECTTHVVEAATCGSDKFCTGLSDKKKKSAESIIATQIARSVFGFVDGPAGIVEQGSSVAQVIAMIRPWVSLTACVKALWHLNLHVCLCQYSIFCIMPSRKGPSTSFAPS